MEEKDGDTGKDNASTGERGGVEVEGVGGQEKPGSRNVDALDTINHAPPFPSLTHKPTTTKQSLASPSLILSSPAPLQSHRRLAMAMESVQRAVRAVMCRSAVQWVTSSDVRRCAWSYRQEECLLSGNGRSRVLLRRSYTTACAPLANWRSSAASLGARRREEEREGERRREEERGGERRREEERGGEK